MPEDAASIDPNVRVITITVDPVRGVGVAWSKNSNAWITLADLDVAHRSVMSIIAPDAARPAASTNGGGAVRSSIIARRVDRA